MPQYNINKSSVTGIDLYVQSTDVGGLLIGLPKQNPNGYVEYLTTELQLGVSGLYYGMGNANNIPALRLDTGTYNYCTAYIYRTNARDGSGNAPLYITGTHVDNVVRECKGSVDFSTEPGASGTYGSIVVGANGDIKTGENFTIDTALTLNSGFANIRTGSTTNAVTLRQGSSAVFNGVSGGVIDLVQEIGTSVLVQQNMIVTNYVSSGAINFSNTSYVNITFTNVDLYAGASWNDPIGIVTTTNGIDLNQCGLENVSITIGKNKRISITAL